MSTKERYGSAVWAAIVEMTDHRLGEQHKWLTVGEIAEKAGVSKPTAKKYLMLLWEMGDIRAACFDGKWGFRANIMRPR